MSKRAEDAALKAYPPIATVPKMVDVKSGTLYDANALKRKEFIKGYEQAEKDLIPLINRLCEAILFDWKDMAELAWKIQGQMKEEKK